MRRTRPIALTSTLAVLASTLTFVGTAAVVAPANAADVSGAWTALGGGLAGTGTTAFQAISDGSGNLYVGGTFTGALDSSGANVSGTKFIAKWNGTSSAWEALGSGGTTSASFDGVYGLATDATGTLYVGGQFASMGGVTSGNFAKWNGSSWSAAAVVSSAWSSYPVEEVARSGDATVTAVGWFTNPNPVANSNGAVTYNGSTFSALGTGLNGRVLALAVDGTNTYVGGGFTTAGGTSTGGIAKWNGSTWSAIGGANVPVVSPTITKFIAGLAVVPSSSTTGRAGDIFIGGNFSSVSNDGTTTVADTNLLAYLDVSDTTAGAFGTWKSLGVNVGTVVETFTVSGDYLYVGGIFSKIGGVSATNVARYNLVTEEWSPLVCGANNGLNGNVRSILPTGDPDGSVYITGAFTNAGGNNLADRIAKFTPGADNCPAGSSAAAPDVAPPVTITFDGNGGVCTPSSITADQGTWGKALTVDQCTNGARRLAFFSTSPTAAAGATNVPPGGNIYFLEPARFYAIWSSEKPSPVTDVVATPGLNSVKVTWKPPVTDGGAPIYDYCVLLRTQTNTLVSALCSKPSEPLERTVTLPATNSKYTFTVVARNAEGSSEPVAGTPVSPYAIKNVVASRPNILLGLGGTKVEASGEAPGLAGQSLNVQYKVGSAQWTTQANAVKVDAKSKFSWSKKFPASANKKVVTVRFTYGADVVSGTYVLPRGGGAGDLSAPRNIKAKGELNKISLTWDPPKFDGGAKIIGYTICAQYIGTLCREVGPGGEGDFRNLLPGAEYSFTVAAKTAAKTGPKGKANKPVTFTEASVRVLEREPGLVTTEVKGKGFKDGAKFRVEVAIVPTNGRPRDTWRWDEIREFTADRSFAKAFGTELGSFYDDQTIAVRLVTPLGSVYSKASRPPR